MGLLDPPLKMENPNIKKLRDTLVGAYASPAKAEEIVNLSGLAPGSFPTGLPNTILIWTKLIEELASQGKLRTLVEMARDDGRVSGFKEVFVEILSRDADPIGHVINQRVVWKNIYLLDRKDLRRQLAQLEPDENLTRVLLVRGESGSGKSHGRHLFNRVAKECGARMTYISEGQVATVREVIELLFSELEALEEIPPTFTTDDAGYKLVINKLKEIALGKKSHLWIAVDDLGVDLDGNPLMDAQIRQFFDQFALMLMNPTLGERFRLMLIDYPEEIPTKWGEEIWAEDRTSRADIQHEHVIELLQEWANAKGRVLTEEQAKDRAMQIVAGGDLSESNRLKSIHKILVDTIGQMEGAL
jgi:hypothetical protein